MVSNVERAYNIIFAFMRELWKIVLHFVVCIIIFNSYGKA